MTDTILVKSVVEKSFDLHSVIEKTGSTWVNTGATSSTNTYDIWITKTSTF